MSSSPRKSPFQRIALSFSGGGARAAGYHLGTLLYLDHIDLLRNVTILSSVSGGSFVNAKYALTLKQETIKNPEVDLHVVFARFYKEFRAYLLDASLVSTAFETLAERSAASSPATQRHNTIITALADAYDSNANFLQGARFGIFWEPGDIHLQHIIFNVTEFKMGLCFRFMKCPQAEEEQYDSYSGSAKIPLSVDVVRDVRLADIVASSSCIPVGMEPISFPVDYVWENPSRAEEIRRYLVEVGGYESIPFMDGGIYDNQGIDSVMFALYKTPGIAREYRKAKVVTARIISDWGDHLQSDHDDPGHVHENDVDLFIVSDTPVPDTNIYTAPDAVPNKGVTLNHLYKATFVLMALSILSALANGADLLVDLLKDQRVGDDWVPNPTLVQQMIAILLLYTVPILFATGVAGALFELRRYLARQQKAIEQGLGHSGGSLWENVRHLRLSQIVDMITMRVNSLVALTDQVFFVRVRSLNYSLVEFNNRLKGKLITHEIFDLLSRERNFPQIDPTDRMINIVQKAATMGTRIWFKSDEEIDWIVACGQITMCYNLADYLLAHQREHAGDPAYEQLLHDALHDWDLLTRDPYTFIKRMQNGGEAPVDVRKQARAAAAHSG